jgi:acyl-lipid omega-6 desaturase (Delta-12 desaturase)
LFFVCIAGVYFFDNPFVKLGFGALAGFPTAFLFVWGHDAAHGALFGFTKKAEVLGTIAMMPSWQMFRLWMYGHNKVHHGFTSFTPIDWIWRPKSPAEYRAASTWSRFVYRVEHSWWGCGWHYILRVWWPGMVTFNPPKDVKEKNKFFVSRAAAYSYIVVASVLAFFFAGGIVGVVAAVVLPWFVFSYLISLFIYLHHTHPDLPMFDDRSQWSAPIGQVACSTIVRNSKVWDHLTHHIGIHTPHHIDMKIPFYRLPQAYDDLQPVYGADIIEYQFKWKTVRDIFGHCQVYDYQTHTWHTYKEALAGA